ncbi:MAG: hypothetical protein AAF733_07995 [Verrucomicrobiota bacterium]
MNPSTRDVLHLGLLLPTVAGLMCILFLFTKSTDYSLGELSFPEAAGITWERVLGAFPAEMPSDYEDDEAFSNIESADDLRPVDEETFSVNNAFLVSCSLFVLIGCFGISLLGFGLRIDEPAWNTFLRGGTVLFIAMFSFYLWGFNLCFPGEHLGIFPRVFFGFPGSMDPVEYGLSGISEWADLFYIATYAAFMGCLLTLFGSSGLTTKTSLILAAPLISVFFPLSTSTLWGGGWIDSLGYSLDFAGASLVHWHVGSVALLIGAVLTWHRKHQSLDPLPLPGILTTGLGTLFYWIGILGINAGSTLSAKPDLVASVVQATFYASIAAGVVCAAVGLLFPQTSALRFFLIGLLAGAVGVSGAADGYGLLPSIFIGILTGAGVAATLVLFHYLRWADPFAIGAIHGVGGFIAVLAAWGGTLGSDYGTTLFGQLLLLVTVPFLALLFTAIILLVAGATKLLSVESGEPTEPVKQPGPPSLPGAS